MAQYIKAYTRGSNSPGYSVLDSYIRVTRPAQALPQTATESLFKVSGGRILVKKLIAEVTTIIQSTDPVLKVSGIRKTDVTFTSTVGTAVDIASTVDLSSLEVGGLVFIEGDGTAAVKSNAGAAFVGTNSGLFIVGNGYITITTGASKTGALKWDLWYEPLDDGTTVVYQTS